ncbi:MAG TPA: helix-turn-helix transcriptional regulator [Streptosporangiaceae bacterium]|nr:helix-turn-helix transcriptional regulator [Streptosporangiaceae bacterium]
MAEPSYGPGIEPIEVVPVVVLSQVFPARPSSIPDIRNFVRHCLAESPLTEEGTREVGETVFRALLDAAGPTGSINVAFRIFPEHVEVDVLHSDSQLPMPDNSGRPGGAAGQGGQLGSGQGYAGQGVGGLGAGYAGQGSGGQGAGGRGSGGQGVGGQGVGGQDAGYAGQGAGGQSWPGHGAGGLGAVGSGAVGSGAAGSGAAGSGAAGYGAPSSGFGPAGQGNAGHEVGHGSDGQPQDGSGYAGSDAGGLADSAEDAAKAAAFSPAGPVPLGGPGQPATFAEWMSNSLRSQNMTQEAAARQLGVSVKTISRWVGGTTEPRMRDLRRIQEVFGTLPLS